MGKIRFSKVQLITMGAMIGFGLFNPFSVAVLEDYFNLVYMGVFIACAGWIVVYVLYKAFKPEAVQLPTTRKINRKDNMKYEVTK